MIDIDYDVSYECDGCRKNIHSEEFYCDTCYDKVVNERDRLLAENRSLKHTLEMNNLEISPVVPHVYMCPALAEILNLNKKAA